VAAVLALLVLFAVGEPRAGLGLGFGLALGGVNALLAAVSARAAGPFRFLSFVRIGFLSAIALGVGLLLQPATAWITVAGVAASQFIMAVLAARSVLRR
jgi:hypothetical protein